MNTAELSSNHREGIVSDTESKPLLADLSSLLEINRLVSHEELSFQHLLLMLQLDRSEEPLIMRDLSVSLGITTAAITGTVDRLEILGYVQRVRIHTDRRKVSVIITRKATELLETIQSALQKSR